MADTTAPSGGRPFPFNLGSRNLAITATVIATMPILFVFVLPKFLTLVGSVLGWTLRKKTDGRRGHLVTLMNDDDKTYWEQHGESKDSASIEELKSAKAFEAGASKAPQNTNKDWDGIVGFFHPFW